MVRQPGLTRMKTRIFPLLSTTKSWAGISGLPLLCPQATSFETVTKFSFSMQERRATTRQGQQSTCAAAAIELMTGQNYIRPFPFDGGVRVCVLVRVRVCAHCLRPEDVASWLKA